MKSFFLICAGIALCIYGGNWPLRGQTTADVSAVVQLSNGQTVTVTDFSNQIGVQPNEIVNVTLQFPSEAIGEPIVVEATDGGSTSLGSSIAVVDVNGSISFAFRAPARTGTKSVGIRRGSTTFRLQFSVLDASRA